MSVEESNKSRWDNWKQFRASQKEIILPTGTVAHNNNYEIHRECLDSPKDMRRSDKDYFEEEYASPIRARIARNITPAKVGEVICSYLHNSFPNVFF